MAREYIERMLTRYLAGLMQRWPAQCRICQRWPQPALCEACITRFAQPAPRCPRCALRVSEAGQLCGACRTSAPPALDAAYAAVDYNYPWVQLIAQFKFHGDVGLARHLAQRMRHTPWAESALDSARWLIPMPLSSQRLRERGYNQATLLARALDPRHPEKVRADLLTKPQDTPLQHELGRKDRLQALRHALHVPSAARGQIQGQRLLLIDDVMTTGASVQAAAYALKSAGAAQVLALVFARTPDPRRASDAA
ncbi:MAG: ComF family protein [Rhodoferax sp.]